MLKKIIIILFIVLIGIVSVFNYFEYKRISNIMIEVLGEENYKYISKSNEEIITAKGSFEGYVYDITDITKVNCLLLDRYIGNSKFLSNFSEKYIEKTHKFCHKRIPDKLDRMITVTIQNDKLVLEIYIN